MFNAFFFFQPLQTTNFKANFYLSQLIFYFGQIFIELYFPHLDHAQTQNKYETQFICYSKVGQKSKVPTQNLAK